MCGFLGRIRSDLDSLRPLDVGTKFISRRGPDSNHYWKSPDSKAELIQARLAIVDTVGRSNQPFSCPHSQMTIAFNGEIYNYEELKRQLVHFPFRTDSDTEVIIAVYREWGLEGLKRLRGMFSFALVDESKSEVVLVRDPIGKKPFFVDESENGVAFGSSVLPLVALRGGAIDDRSKRQFWRDGFVGPNRSIMNQIVPILPGEVRIYASSGRLISKTDCRPSKVDFEAKSIEEVQFRFQELLSQSVQRRMHNNPSPACLLSGGIDSTVVSLAANRIESVRNLTLAAGPSMVPDTKFAKYAATKCQLPLEMVRVAPGDIADEVQWALNLQDEPLGMISFYLLSLLVRASKEHARVLLTGDGGDEVFCGYGVPQEWTEEINTVDAVEEDDLQFQVGSPVPAWVSRWGRYSMGYSLVGHNFAKVDRASAEQGVEIRSPLLDWDLVDFARQLTPSQIFLGNRSKGLLKSYLSEWPDWFVERRKSGFTYRIRWVWGASRFRGLRDLVSMDAVEAFGEWIPKPLRKDPKKWRTWSIFKHFPEVWKLLAWEQFSRRLSQVQVGV